MSVGGWSVLVFEITPLPGFDEVGPGNRVEYVHGRHLTGVIVTLCTLFEGEVRSFFSIPGQGSGKYPSFGHIIIQSGYLNIVIGYRGFYEVPLELFFSGARSDDGCREVNRVRYHQLYHTELIAIHVLGDECCLAFEAYRCEFHFITFEYGYGEYTLIVGDGSTSVMFIYDTDTGEAAETVSRHHHSIKLDNGILEAFKLCFCSNGKHNAQKDQVW